MGLIPPAVVNLVLMGAFGLYCLMGLVFLVLGLLYMGDAGVIGSTGVYLLILGMLMVAVGGIGIFANMKNMWMVLFIIELINVAIFLVRKLRACYARSCRWGLIKIAFA